MCGLQSAWKTLFDHWPAEMPRRGMLLTSLNEPIPFNGFMTGEDFVVLSRPAPDSLGARTVLLPYGNLAALKITDVIKSKAFQAAGFHGELGQH
jgi:hypothetical protein